MKKEIHFYESVLNVPFVVDIIFNGWYETQCAIQCNKEYIITTQMGLLSTSLFEMGYRIFVHPQAGDAYEIKLGANTCADREIREAHNLFHMWRAGVFCAHSCE